MKLLDLEPEFLWYYTEDGHIYHRSVDTIAEANGVMFLCPKCFKANGGRVGTHSIICWDPTVPPLVHPRPGRWKMVGTSLDDLTLVGEHSNSVLLTNGCAWHGYLERGEVRDA